MTPRYKGQHARHLFLRWLFRVSGNVFILLLIVLLARHALAYDRHLDSSSVRDAYFLGSDRQRAAAFLVKYLHVLPATQAGPHISEIEVRTPFAQVVQSSRAYPVGYNAQQAQQDYEKDPGKIQVRIRILSSPTFVGGALLPPPGCQGAVHMNSVQECFPNFHFSFRQVRNITPRQTYGVAIYAGGESPVLVGGDVWFTFRTADIASAPLSVTVTTSDGHDLSAEFDLAGLR